MDITKEGSFFMKFTKEAKINMYHDRLNGESFTQLSLKYNVCLKDLRYTFRLIELHGKEIVLRKRNKKYSKTFKENAIDRVLLKGEAATSVALDLGLLRPALLFNWIRKYKENGYNVIEKKRGRKPTTKLLKDKHINTTETQEDKLKRIEEENEYLRAENEFLKKWNSVVQQIEKQKKKK